MHHHAVVIGGSITGLLASRVLLNHCDRVTLIERDLYPPEAEFRQGVPQARQVHQLLVRGKVILERLFPEIEKELLNAGAVRGNSLDK